MKQKPLLVAILAVFGSVTATTPPSEASPPSVGSLQAEARAVEAQVRALDEELTVADERLNDANLRLVQVRKAITVNKRELRVAKRNLERGQRSIARRLVLLYSTERPSALEVIIGARSVEEVASRLDAEHRISALDLRVVAQVRFFKAAARSRARALASKRARAEELTARARRTKAAIATRLAERRRILASVSDEIRSLLAAQRSAMRQADQEAARRARARYGQSTTATPNVLGIAAQTPEGAVVLPPASHPGVVGVALSFLGTPYVWGGMAPGGFDCSGLIAYAYARLGVTLPHSSYAQYNYGMPVSKDQLQPGDLVFFDGLGHEGLYVGGGQFVHAPHTGDVVKVSSLNEAWYTSNYVGARRLT